MGSEEKGSESDVTWTAEKQAEYRAKWYREHREEQRAYQRVYREVNREALLANQRANRARRAEGTRRWKQANAERVAEIERRRRLRKRNNGQEPYVRAEIFERDEWRCGICHGPVDHRLRPPRPGAATIDHIIPLSVGGSDSPGNVRLAHFGCNAAGGAACAWNYGKRREAKKAAARAS